MNYVVTEIGSILLLAIALGMDAFSVCLGIGLNGVRLKEILMISLLIGFFHALMPFLGIVIGDFINDAVGEIAVISSSIVLIVIGLEMISWLIFPSTKKVKKPQRFGLFIFVLTVSLDSFSVGLSLGMIGLRVAVTLFIFAIVAASMSFTGLFLGKKIQAIVGHYGRVIGGIILIVFGLKILLGFC